MPATLHDDVAQVGGAIVLRDESPRLAGNTRQKHGERRDHFVVVAADLFAHAVQCRPNTYRQSNAANAIG